jgi:fructoselysine-6-P-deglycase FrlB-like protein
MILRDAITHAAGSRRPSRAVFLGSGALAAAARESALKVLELAQGQIPTLWDTTLGFRHGPKAIADAGTRIHVFISGTAHTSRYDLDAVGELRAQFGDECVVVLGSKGTDADIAIPVIGNDAWTLVLHVLVAQIQAIVWSDSLKVNVDNPFVDGNLSRVVSGVALYPYAGVR